MYEPTNPYASPAATGIDPVAAKWLGSDSASLRRVAVGLGMIYTGIVLAFLAIMLMVGVYLLRAADVIELATRAAGLLALIGLLLDLIGGLFCLATPPETRALGLIFASVAAMFFWTFLVIAQVLHLVGYLDRLPSAAPIVQQVIGGISVLTFILFLRRLARFISRADLARRAIGVFIYASVLWVFQLGLEIYLIMGGRAPMMNLVGSLIVIVSVVVAYAVALILFANLVTYTRKAILSGGPNPAP
jgi:hypothetical protein